MPNRLRTPETLCMAGAAVSKGKRPLRALSASDKIEAIQRVNDGESKASVARQIGVPESTLRGWCKNEDKLRYMSSRHSTPDTDKSSDGILDNGIPEKRTKYDLNSVPVNFSHNNGSQYNNDIDIADTQQSIDHNGLDLSRLKEPTDRENKPMDGLNSNYSQFSKSLEFAKGISDLNKANSDVVTNLLSKDNKLKIDPGAKISMSAISPLSTLNHLSGISGLGQNHLGMSFNEIATNLSLIAQLNPSLNTLANSINTSSKVLRSIRSPKPGHSSGNNSCLNVDKHKSDRKLHSHSDSYNDKNRTRSNHNSYKDHPVDDALWYWFKKQQAMLNLANTTSSQIPMSLSHSLTSNRNGKDNSLSRNSTLAGIPPVIPSLDKNSWFWQYYKQFSGNLNLLDEKNKSSFKIENNDNILYSHLTKEKQDVIPVPENHIESENKIEEKEEEIINKDCNSPSMEKMEKDNGKNQIKVRAVLDNLLLLNNNNVPLKETAVLEESEKDSNTENEFSCEVSEALEHGEKFLKWLEACQEPSVTRMQVHQLKGLLNNIKANASRRNQESCNKDRISRRK